MSRNSAARVCFLTFFLFTSLWFCSAEATELFIPEIKGKPGRMVEIPVMIDETDNLAGVKLVMKYDSDLLTYKKAVKTQYTSSLMHIVNDKKPGLLIIVMAGAKGIKGKDFPIISITFETRKNITGNHKTRLEITEIQLMSDKLKDIKVKTDTKFLTISP